MSIRYRYPTVPWRRYHTTNPRALKMGIPLNRRSANKSRSPEIIASALPAVAASKTKLSAGSARMMLMRS